MPTTRKPLPSSVVDLNDAAALRAVIAAQPSTRKRLQRFEFAAGLKSQRFRLHQTDELVGYCYRQIECMRALFRLLCPLNPTEKAKEARYFDLSKALTKLKGANPWISELSYHNQLRICRQVARDWNLNTELHFIDTAEMYLGRTDDKRNIMQLHLPGVPPIHLNPLSDKQEAFFSRHVYLIEEAILRYNPEMKDYEAVIRFPAGALNNSLPKWARVHMTNNKIFTEVLLERARLTIHSRVHPRDVALLMHADGWVGPKIVRINGERLKGYEYVGKDVSK